MKLIENKNLIFNYFILETYEAGLVLKGWEVKPIKYKNNIQIKNSFIFIKNKEFFLKESYINIEDKIIKIKKNRDRKLLLNKIEIKNIINKLYKNKYTIIPLNIFLKKNIIKIKIALALKKKIYIKNKFKNFKKNENYIY